MPRQLGGPLEQPFAQLRDRWEKWSFRRGFPTRHGDPKKGKKPGDGASTNQQMITWWLGLVGVGGFFGILRHLKGMTIIW
jgi:hypothetical protein